VDRFFEAVDARFGCFEFDAVGDVFIDLPACTEAEHESAI